MELARPAYVAVADLDIMCLVFFCAFWRASGDGAWAATLVRSLCVSRDGGRERDVVVRCVSRERPCSRRSTGAFCGPVTEES